MPIIQIYTSAKVDEKKADLLCEKLTEVAVNVVKKPLKYAQIQVIDGIKSMMGGSKEPSCFVKVYNIGGFEKKKTAEAIAKAISDLGVCDLKKIYVQSNEIDREDFAYFM